MSDRYAKIRKALEMKPTPGPWKTDGTFIENKTHIVAISHNPENYKRDAALIAACDPDTIRELLAERDALAAGQPQQGSVKVKPLEWTEFTFAGLPSFWNAEAAPFGVYYRIERDRDCFWMSLGEEWSLHDTPEEAKAAAQADYERRILSALEVDDERS